MNEERRASHHSSLVTPRPSFFHPVEVDRAAEDSFGLAASELVEVVDALLLRQLRAVVEAHRDGRAVKEARADGDVARLLWRLPRPHEKGRPRPALER